MRADRIHRSLAVSLTLGLAVSGLARNPFQVVQLLLAFVMPQVMLSGIFDLSQSPAWLQAVASALPLGYARRPYATSCCAARG